ncbi:hypothetical protein KTD15_06320 [Burkholderia multivorans]|uniref:hypothetical protein n=1 Tax=Burkholderia multivorans TaxID=87883 RepID=UPI001C223B24|nr:hypothetical protein [Burkholderia multivorans]MBU9118409.1 hypothetical protein [Burkholderia multivorans]
MKNKQEYIALEKQAEEIDFFKRIEKKTQKEPTAAEVKEVLLEPLKFIFSKETFEAIKYLLGIAAFVASPLIAIYLVRLLGLGIFLISLDHNSMKQIEADNKLQGSCAVKILKMQDCNSEFNQYEKETFQPLVTHKSEH